MPLGVNIIILAVAYTNLQEQTSDFCTVKREVFHTIRNDDIQIPNETIPTVANAWLIS